jgi:dolichyl-phosphate-mannose-protein mannosyltransferase
MSPRKARLLAALGLFSVSFATRCLYAVDLAPVMLTQQQPGIRMAMRYDDAALGMLHGDGILYPAEVDPAKTGLLARPPGYAFLLRTIYATLGRSFFTVQLVQNVLDSITPVLLFLLAARLLGVAAGAVGGLLAALSPHLAHASNLISPDALSALPLLGASFLLSECAPDREVPLLRATATGALVGLSAWLRPNLVLMGPFLAAALFAIARKPRRAAGPLALMAASAMVTISPITLRNYLVFHDFIPISINGGLTLWQGVADAGGERYGARVTDRKVSREEAARYGRPEYARWWAEPDGIWRDRERYRRSYEVLRQRPLWYLGTMARRVGEMVSYHSADAPLVLVSGEAAAMAEADDDETTSEDHLAPLRRFRAEGEAAPPPILSDRRALAPGEALAFVRLATRAAQRGAALATLPLLLLGAVVVCLRDWRLLAWLAAIPVYYFVFESMFLYEWRVAVPMHYHLFAVAGAGAVWLARRAARVLGRAKAL